MALRRSANPLRRLIDARRGLRDTLRIYVADAILADGRAVEVTFVFDEDHGGKLSDVASRVTGPPPTP